MIKRTSELRYQNNLVGKFYVHDSSLLQYRNKSAHIWVGPKRRVGCEERLRVDAAYTGPGSVLERVESKRGAC
jgi:hypothetical protein